MSFRSRPLNPLFARSIFAYSLRRVASDVQEMTVLKGGLSAVGLWMSLWGSDRRREVAEAMIGLQLVSVLVPASEFGGWNGMDDEESVLRE